MRGARNTVWPAVIKLVTYCCEESIPSPEQTKDPTFSRNEE